MDFLTRLFDTSDFPPRWECGYWSAGHGWLHVLSDLGVWSAYVAIPVVLGFFILRRRDLPFRAIFLLFGAFIFACGTTHLMEAIIFWWPAYRLAGVIKLFTAVVSWATVIALIPTVPRVLAMRSPEELEREVAARERAEVALQGANDELEKRIDLRTAELTRANAELRLERERFSTTLASIGDAVIATDAAGRVTFQNPVAEGLTGWGDEALGRDLAEVFAIVNEQTGAAVESPVAKVLREGTVVGLANHTVLVAKDGTRRPIDDSGAPIRGAAGGAIAGVVLVFRDVTERRRVEQSLEAARGQAQLVADAVPALIAYIDTEARYRLNNRAYETWFGRHHGELPGLHMRDVVGVAAWEAIRGHVESALAGREVNYEAQVPYQSGGSRWISATYVPDVGPGGAVRGIVAHVIDITGRKRVEEALQEADRRKDEFLATLAHELRNPLAPIRNGLEVMRLAGPDGPAAAETRAMMARQLAQLVRLVDDLLDVSRISRGKLELRRERLDLAEVVASAVETCTPVLKERGHSLSVESADGPVYVDADRTRLAQALCNLLNNAAKYTEPGGQVCLGVKHDGGEAIVSVADTGDGIPATMLPRVFDMFTQVDQSLEKAHGGLGIGLTIVKRLVEMHGGTVEARSAGPGQGSEFIVRLPAADAPLDHAPPAHPAPPVRRPTARKVLVVDDNRDAAVSLAMVLRTLGHDARTAYDGHAAVAEAEAHRPDVVLLDIGMPGLNGYDVARCLRERPWGRELKLVALTGWGQEEDKARSRAAGFDLHLVKPVDPQALEQMLADGEPPRP